MKSNYFSLAIFTFSLVFLLACDSEGPSITVHSPKDGSTFPPGTRSVVLNFDAILFVGFPENSIPEFREYGYRIDNEETVVFPVLTPEIAKVGFSGSIPIPEPIVGMHQIYVYARAANTDDNMASTAVRFRVLTEPEQLSEYRWDGGGDNLRWADPDNWEEDRLPNENEIAIVDLEGANRVLVSSEFKRTFTVGAIDIHADLTIDPNTTLELNAAATESYVRNSLRFKLVQLYEADYPVLRFGPQTEGSSLTIEDTLFIAGATFTTAPENQVGSNYIISDDVTYDAAGLGENSEPFANVENGVKLIFRNRAEFNRGFQWELNGQAPVTDGNTEIINEGTWTMDEVRFEERGEFTVSANLPARITNNGIIRIRRTADFSVVSIDGNIILDNAGGILTDSLATPDLGRGTFTINRYSFWQPNTPFPIPLNLENIYTQSDMTLGSGSYLLQDVHAPSLTLNYSTGGNEVNQSSVSLIDPQSEIDHVSVRSGRLFLNQSSGPLRSVRLWDGGQLTVENATIDSLVVDGTGTEASGKTYFNIIDTLRTQFINWANGENRSSKDGVLIIQPHPLGIPSIFQPGRIFSIEEHTYNNQTIVEGKLSWRYSNLVSGISGNHTGLIQIRPNGEMAIDGGFELTLYPQSNLGSRRMNIEVSGLLQLGLFQRATIWGCVYEIGEGRIEDSRNGLNIETNGWFCEDEPN